MINVLEDLLNKQKEYFATGVTRSYEFRIDELTKLKEMLDLHETEIYQALKNDLNKSPHEVFTTELGVVYAEVNFAIKYLIKWMDKEKVKTPTTHRGSSSYIYKEPYGATLIISPWNYPLQLTLAPLIGAIAAGNCAIVKPAPEAKETSQLIYDMINKTFDKEYVTVIQGEAEVSKQLTTLPFDYIFFTGSTPVGKDVMRQASEHLTPLTLELGGKSPVVVDEDVYVKKAAKRIIWGKFTNAGQTCVAPDYVLVHESKKNQLLRSMIRYIKRFYSKKPLDNKNYVKIVNEKHFNRLTSYLEDGTVIYGGSYDESKLCIEPTLITDVPLDTACMQDEIFGPILPVLTYETMDEAVEIIESFDKPLALYYFGNNSDNEERIIHGLSFGGGCVNDTLFHLANPHLPFGGVGPSGTGSYHGKYSFDTFSHDKSILKQTNKFDLPFRYPNGKFFHKIMKKVMN